MGGLSYSCKNEIRHRWKPKIEIHKCVCNTQNMMKPGLSSRTSHAFWSTEVLTVPSLCLVQIDFLPHPSEPLVSIISFFPHLFFFFFPSSHSPFLTRNFILFHLINSNSHHLPSPSSPPPISLPIHSYLLPCTSFHSHLLPQTPALRLPSPSAIPPPPMPSAFPSTQFDFSPSSMPTPDREGVADYMSSL